MLSLNMVLFLCLTFELKMLKCIEVKNLKKNDFN